MRSDFSKLAGKRILVTGSQGFIGRAVVKRLRVAGAVPIAWSRTDVDLRLRKQTIRLMKEAGPDVVVHLATSMRGRADSFVGRPVDLLLSIHVQEAIAEAGVKSFLHVGTLDEYGNGPTPFVETQAIQPLTSYSAAKASAGLFWTMSGGIHARLPIVYGPGQDLRFFIPQLLRSLVANESFRMSPGEQIRDFIYIDDVVEGIARLLTVPCNGQYVNLCTGTGRTLKDVAFIAEKMLKSTGMVELGALPYRQREVFHCVGSPSKMELLTGWRPQTTLEEGLRACLTHLQP